MCCVAFCIHHILARISVGGERLLERRARTECALGVLYRYQWQHEN